MRVAAVIAEFNPFHNGHAHLMNEVRRAGAQWIVAVMSGCYVQRGEPALYSKWVRARAALLSGVDLVLELPLPYAISGAQRFARGAAALCGALGCVDTLAFGCEAPRLADLQRTRALLDSPRLPALLAEEQRARPGITFAAARTAALCRLGGEAAAQTAAEPNNALALEYLAALRTEGGAIEPFAVRRVGAGHDSPLPEGRFASATALRTRILAGEDAAPYLPAAALPVYEEAPRLDRTAFETALLSHLRRLGKEELARLPELSEGLEHRLYAAIREARTLEELYRRMKSKRYTHARLRRLALAAFLGVEDRHTRMPPPYLRILGYTAAGRELIEGGRARLPLGGSLRRLERLGGPCEEFAALEAAAGDQYALFSRPRSGCGCEYTAGVLHF
ncbi:MAG: nucleotidyltransferase family protein [Provencibacterium sp.]|nr:nucleotidyltransferase family protein [Provencibacterium sp.]